MTRRFTRLNPGTTSVGAGHFPVPSDGMCLSAFLVLRDPQDSKRVLLGRIAPDPRWEERGGLDPQRAARFGNLWMLPSSQLLFFESPTDAAHRIEREILGIEVAPLDGPQVFSDAYRRPTPMGEDPHWDLHFIFTGTGPARPPEHPLWRELAYVPVGETHRVEFARNQGDVLELVGLAPMGGSASA